jgi:hypothetical protein
LLVAACVVPSSPIFVTLMKEAQVPPKRRFLQEPHGVTTQKIPFFIVTAVKTSNLTLLRTFHKTGYSRICLLSVLDPREACVPKCSSRCMWSVRDGAK